MNEGPTIDFTLLVPLFSSLDCLIPLLIVVVFVVAVLRMGVSMFLLPHLAPLLFSFDGFFVLLSMLFLPLALITQQPGISLFLPSCLSLSYSLFLSSIRYFFLPLSYSHMQGVLMRPTSKCVSPSIRPKALRFFFATSAPSNFLLAFCAVSHTSLLIPPPSGQTR